jgi:hypothetical protein
MYSAFEWCTIYCKSQNYTAFLSFLPLISFSASRCSLYMSHNMCHPPRNRHSGRRLSQFRTNLLCIKTPQTLYEFILCTFTFVFLCIKMQICTTQTLLFFQLFHKTVNIFISNGFQSNNIILNEMNRHLHSSREVLTSMRNM